MILIDQDTDAKLASRLEKIKAEGLNARCIYLNLKGNTQPEVNINEKIVTAARQHIFSVDTQIFLCGDGDIFILAPSIAGKSGREFILDVAGQIGRPASEEWVRFVELPLHAGMLLVEVETKLEKRRKAEEAKRKALEQQQAEKKRQAILNGGSTVKQEEIKNRRAARKSAEMMIVEDDAVACLAGRG